MAIGQRRKTRIRTAGKGRKRRSSLWVFLSLVLMMLILLSLFFLRTKIAEIIHIISVNELIEQDTGIRPSKLNNDIKNDYQVKENVANDVGGVEELNSALREEYKKEDLDYLNRIIKRK